MAKNASFQNLTEKDIGLMAARFRALSEVSRLKLIFAAATGLSQANVSKHLALLAAAGILTRKKEGQCVYYGMRDQLTIKVCELVHTQIAA